MRGDRPDRFVDADREDGERTPLPRAEARRLFLAAAAEGRFDAECAGAD